jgi:uncharacterized protein (TIGR03435 family)
MSVRLAVLLAGAVLCRAQAPVFEAATVKMGGPEKDGLITINTGRIQHGLVTLANATLGDCIKFAYSLTTEDQIAGPDWIKQKQVRFEVTGKSAPGTPEEQQLLMLQSLLKERFGLAFHMEQRVMTHYELVVGKKGPKLVESTVEEADGRGAARLDGITSNRITMNKLAMLISRMTRMPVLDKTGLKGYYEVKLQWSPEDITGKTEENPLGPPIFTAVQEQLGLKLESRKGPVDVLVVDHAEKVPLAN